MRRESGVTDLNTFPPAVSDLENLFWERNGETNGVVFTSTLVATKAHNSIKQWTSLVNNGLKLGLKEREGKWTSSVENLILFSQWVNDIFMSAFMSNLRGGMEIGKK